MAGGDVDLFKCWVSNGNPLNHTTELSRKYSGECGISFTGVWKGKSQPKAASPLPLTSIVHYGSQKARKIDFAFWRHLTVSTIFGRAVANAAGIQKSWRCNWGLVSRVTARDSVASVRLVLGHVDQGLQGKLFFVCVWVYRFAVMKMIQRQSVCWPQPNYTTVLGAFKVQQVISWLVCTHVWQLTIISAIKTVNQ